MALGADRESLAVEICRLMPNKTAVEAAIKLAERQKRRTLVQTLSQIAEQKLEEELNQLEDEEEDVQEIRQTTHLSINMRSETEVTKNSDFQLKPKPLRRVEEESNSRLNSDESDSDSNLNERLWKRNVSQAEEEDSNSVSLKPKPVAIPKHSNGNPFKVTQKESKRENKRKRERDSSEESDDEEPDERGFDLYFSDMKNIIKVEYPDIEDEEELKVIAMRQYKQLDSKERNDYIKRELKKKRKNDDTNPTNKENTNKITKFFTRN